MVGKSSHEITKKEATPVRINELEDSTLQAATIEYWDITSDKIWHVSGAFL